MIRIRQIRISIVQDTKKNLLEKIAKKLRINPIEIIDFQINKKSIDSRNKKNINFIYEVDVNLKNNDEILSKINNKDIILTPNEKYQMPSKGNIKLDDKIIIVGSGPAGLFCAYLLAECGYKPLIIERGQSIENRIKDVENFWQNNELKTNSNVQFGEGGAGTFSDGKLNTLTNDKFYRNKKVLEIFVACGAPKNILYLQKPHIGTDILRKVIINIRQKIIQMGGQFLFNSCMTDIIIENNALKAIEINNSKILTCQKLILAIGHSARDTFELLKNKHLNLKPKPFAVGVRIIHPQQLINNSQYGDYAKYLSAASYKLTYTTKAKRGVYSFCMCPGGYVVNSSSENKGLVINGMSNYLRDNEYANSAIVVTVDPKDFGSEALDGVKFQRKLEQKAYEIGRGNIPIQTWQSFINKGKNNDYDNKAFKGRTQLADLRDIFPTYICDSLIEAIPQFGKKIKGFDNPNTILAAVESRTSSPVRIIRNDNFESNILGIYPCGEGAGYAGGIITSAIDGIKVAETIIKRYKPFN